MAANKRAFLLLAILLGSCAQNQPIPIEPLLPTVGTVILNRSIAAPPVSELLDIGVRVFANPLSDEETVVFGELAFDEIRNNETHYLPFLLRNTLIDANHWGAVRVLPQEDPSMDLLISGSVIRSDGQRLELHIDVKDSTGREWLSKDYADITAEEDFPASTRYTPGNRFDEGSFVDPFQDLYDQINNDLVAVRVAITAETLVEIRRVSQMVYAADLSPEVFSHILATDPSGRLSVNSLPAVDDPMLARVEDMRLRHHLFIDTVDEYYQALYEDMQPTYVTWRRYSYDQIEQTETALQEAYDASRYSSSRGYLALTQRYDRYRWSKIYELEFQELATGFNREIAPAILELNKQVHGLSGTMEEQYIQWRRILRELFALETGQQ